MILWLYQALFPLVILGVLLRLVLLGRGAILREGLAELRQRLGLPSREELGALVEEGRPSLWVHAASVGEVRAAEPLLRRLAAAPDAPRMVVTTSTVAGRERARAAIPEVPAVLAPMDFHPCVRAFLRRIRPAGLVLVETELWPMTLLLCRGAGIPAALVNGRVTPRAFGRYRLLGGWTRSWLEGFRTACVQTRGDADRLAALGMPASVISVEGNMKYDAQPPASERVEYASSVLGRLGWGEDPVWVAGSTRRGEEGLLLEAHALLRRAAPRARLVLAPRHPERAEEAVTELSSRGESFIRWSELESGRPPASPPGVLLLDRLGMLGPLYAAGRAAFVGGTLVPVGGHDLLEPARFSVPVLFGPHDSSVRETAEALIEAGGGRRVGTPAELASVLEDLLLRPGAALDGGAKALAVARSLSGATDRTLLSLSPFLSALREGVPAEMV